MRPIQYHQRVVLFCLYLLCHAGLASCFSPNPPQAYPIHAPGTLYIYDSALVLDDGYQLSVQGILGGIIFMALGLVLWLRSFDANRVLTKFSAGFVTFGLVTWVMLANFEPQGTYGVNRWTIYLIVPMCIGFLGGLFIWSCDHVSVFLSLLGSLGGLSFGLWILGWRSGLSITSTWGQAVLLAILVAAGFFWASCHPMGVIFGSAIAGTYMLFIGLDFYFHTGFTYCATTVLDANKNHAHDYVAYKETLIMQGVMILGFIVGTISQCISARHYKHMNDQFYDVHGGFLSTRMKDRRFLPWGPA